MYSFQYLLIVSYKGRGYGIVRKSVENLLFKYTFPSLIYI